MKVTDQADGACAQADGTDLLLGSLLYRVFLREREQVLDYKRREVERSGRDIGFEAARLGWALRHRSRWRKARSGEASLER
jgi:hypothetical protein